ncbi:MAG TPA: hypothetical protein VEL07_05860 [Planctomycetota bacterium]|nr:hypothetical protein [Planctomycetota bacterium]
MHLMIGTGAVASWRCLLIGVVAIAMSTAGEAPARPDPFAAILATVQPLAEPRGDRAPLWVWTCDYPLDADDATLRAAVAAMEARGIGLFCRWTGDAAASAARCIRLARIQRELGAPVAIDLAGDLIHGVHDGSDATAHHDADGTALLSDFMVWKAGCPFADLDDRLQARTSKIDAFLAAYAAAGVEPDFITGDYEFDGPSEWNDSWALAKRCVACRARIPAIDDDFTAYQRAVRAERSRWQKELITATVKARFPRCRVGVYGMNPHDGHRYWHDFFESHTRIPGVAYVEDHGAAYRPWAHEFDAAGYDVAMPVCYILPHAFAYAVESAEDQAWFAFANLLREGGSAGAATPAEVPIYPFVHADPAFAVERYEEALWHLLLRGADSFCMWCPAEAMAAQLAPVHRVWAAAGQHRDFLAGGTPVVSGVPPGPGPAVSALKLGGRLLVRRTDGAPHPGGVSLAIDRSPIDIPAAPGRCQVIDLP